MIFLWSSYSGVQNDRCYHSRADDLDGFAEVMVAVLGMSCDLDMPKIPSLFVLSFVLIFHEPLQLEV